jgi:hypothetical protein
MELTKKPKLNCHLLKNGINEKKSPGKPKDEQPSKPEPEPRIWRAIFSPIYQQKILFSQKVKIRTDKMPRLKPHITIDRRTQMRAEDE